jgi:hypothetical protein
MRPPFVVALPLLALVELAPTPALAAADVLGDWNALAVEQAHAAGLAAPAATRVLAIAQLAAFEALNAPSNEYEPFHTALQVDQPVNQDAATASAVHDALVALLPQQASAVDAALQKTLARIEPGPAKDHGVELGQRAATELLALRQSDGATAVTSYPGSTDPGKWRPTPRADTGPEAVPLAALSPEWRLLTPFALARPGELRPEPPPALTSSEFTIAFLQVKGDGALTSVTRSDDQTELALFWSQPLDAAFNRLARTLAKRQALPLVAEARLLALLNVALADAVIASWDAKYRYGFWRPVSAIRSSDDFGNPNAVANPTWAPLVETPNSPEYPNELSASGAAALRVLVDVLGGDDIAFALDSSATIRIRKFASLSVAEDELTDSARYSGASFKFSAEAGRKLGQQVGDRVVRSILQAPGAASGGAAGAPGGSGDDAEATSGAPSLAGPGGAGEPAAEPSSGGAPAGGVSGSALPKPAHGKSSGCSVVHADDGRGCDWGLGLALALTLALARARRISART